MSDKDLNFDKIWGANGDINYDFTDDNYLTGWDFIGNVPPARGMFNRLQHDTDRKQKYLNDHLKALSIKQYTVNDAKMPTGNTGLPDTLFSGIGNRIKNITGENDWKAAPAATLSELKKNLAALEVKNYTVNDANAPTGNTALVDVLLSGIGNRLKNITGESDWKTAPAATIRALKNALDDLPNQQYTLDDTKAPATNTATLLTLISNLANEVKQNKGTSDWKTAPATNLATLATLASNLASGADVTWSGNKFTNAKLGITGLMEQNGYICFGKNFGGLILQWGNLVAPKTDNWVWVTNTFPIAFASACFSVSCCVELTNYDYDSEVEFMVRKLQKKSVDIRFRSDHLGRKLRWIALGT